MSAEPRHEGLRIGGQVLGAGRAAHIAVHNPYTGALVGTVPKATLAEVRQAFAIAKGYRARLSRYERANILNTAAAAVLAHLDDHGAAGSAELRAALPQLEGMYDPAPGKRWGGPTPLAPRVLTVLSVRGDILRGPNDGGWTSSRPRWVRTDSWLDSTVEPLAVEAAQAELVRAWLRAFGPATLADVTWWFGSTLTAARRALATVGAVEVQLTGTGGYVLPEDLEPVPAPPPWAALLPGLDVTTMGWTDRDWYLGEHRGQVFDSNGNAGPTARSSAIPIRPARAASGPRAASIAWRALATR